MAIKTISVLGCGWLGLPLAEELVKAGYKVKGSTTTPDKVSTLSAKGIKPFLLSFPENSPKTELASFLEADVLIFNLPPSKSSSETTSYEQLLQTVLQGLSTKTKAVIFVSSTSVYPDLNREVVEKDALASALSPSLMLRCEHLVQQVPHVKSTVVRFGGLMGGSRHPGRWLAGKSHVPQPEGPVNMIHLWDCVRIIRQIVEEEKWGFTFNACAPKHPTRHDFYTGACQLKDLPPPSFAPQGEPHFKRISSSFLQEELPYRFIFPDPLSCLTSPDF